MECLTKTGEAFMEREGSALIGCDRTFVQPSCFRVLHGDWWLVL